MTRHVKPIAQHILNQPLIRAQKAKNNVLLERIYYFIQGPYDVIADFCSLNQTFHDILSKKLILFFVFPLEQYTENGRCLQYGQTGHCQNTHGKRTACKDAPTILADDE